MADKPKPVLVLEVSVYPFGMDFVTHSDEGHGWEPTREALHRIRDEIDRILAEGPAKCPFAPKGEQSR